jgi:hypothetical protein
LIRLRGCAGWSGSMLVANPLCWFCHDAAHIVIFGKSGYIREWITYVCQFMYLCYHFVLEKNIGINMVLECYIFRLFLYCVKTTVLWFKLNYLCTCICIFFNHLLWPEF